MGKKKRHGGDKLGKYIDPLLQCTFSGKLRVYGSLIVSSHIHI